VVDLVNTVIKAAEFNQISDYKLLKKTDEI
jgi:hypothetical protein